MAHFGIARFDKLTANGKWRETAKRETLASPL
jgi:hypothetical protein